MITDILKIEKLISPLIFIIGGFMLGLIFERIIIREIRKLSAKTKRDTDEIFIQAFKRTILLLFTVAGIYLAMESTEISPEILNLIDRILLIIVIFAVTMILSRISVGFVNVYSRKAGGAFASTSIFTNLTRVVVFIIGILIILESLGISVTPILTALGVGGLAVALALQDTLSNLFAGIHVIASGEIKPGHYLRLSSGEEGRVTDITWRYTTIKSLPNNMIIVPNSKLASAIVTNYNMPVEEMSFSVQIGVGYDSDLEKVEAVTVEVAKEVMEEIPGGVPVYKPVLSFHTFGDFSINFSVSLRVSNFASQYFIKHEFIKRVKKRYHEEGIDIPFPVRTLYMKKMKEPSSGD